MLIVRASEVRNLLPMRQCIETMDRAMRALSRGDADTPKRLLTRLGGSDDFFILMPGAMRDPPLYGAKLVSLQPGNPSAGLPAVQGFIVLFERSSGTPIAMVDGGEITRIRTAAASALATRELARGDAGTHGILGAGAQAASHLEAIACVRDIRQVRVWARDSARARAFASEQSHASGLRVEAVDRAEEASACDIVSVVTNASEPVLKGAWLSQGSHLNLVGAHEPEHREADSDAVAAARIYVDSRAGALQEAGDLLIPMSEGRISSDDIVGELGELLLGSVPGRASEQQITLYKSLGNIVQDLFAAAQVLAAAEDGSVGSRIDFP
jgi:ornithine cyclodeaminase